LSIRVFRQVLQDVFGVNVSILLSLGLESDEQKRKWNEVTEESHDVQVGENKGVRGHNV
jgi:primosomal protein N'